MPTIDESHSQKLALLSLLRGPLIDLYMDLLRQEGAQGPSEMDYVELERQGLAVRGAATGGRIPTPQGRRQAAGIALILARRHKSHHPVVGIDGKRKVAYFRCTCGAQLEQRLDQGAAYTHVRKFYDEHVQRLARAIETSPMAFGDAADADAMLAGRLQAFIRGGAPS